MPLSLFGADHKPALRARRDRKAVGTAEVTRGSESENKGEGGGAGGGATEEPGGAAGGGGGQGPAAGATRAFHSPV